MSSIEKFHRLAGYAHENAVRLHLDSIHAYSNDSYATAYLLSILASEEIGKSMMLEEYAWQHMVNGWSDSEPETRKWLESIFSLHTKKHGWFARVANDFLNAHPHIKKSSVILREMSEGLTEQNKQKTTYVGLTKKGKKVDLNGKVIAPHIFGQPEKAEKQITINNDFLIVLISGFIRGMYSVDTYYVAVQLNREMFSDLSEAWPIRGRDARRILKEHEKYPVLVSPLQNWE